MDPIEELTNLVDEMISAMNASHAAQDNPQGHTADTLRELQERVRRAREALEDFIRRHPNIDLSGLTGSARRRMMTRLRLLFGPGIDRAFGATGRAARGFGRLFGRVLGLLGSGVVGGVLEVLLSPTPISRLEEEILNAFEVRLGGKCFRVTLFRDRWMGEIMWSTVQTRSEEVECPEKEIPT